jgi:hypothetical protein
VQFASCWTLHGSGGPLKPGLAGVGIFLLPPLIDATTIVATLEGTRRRSVTTVDVRRGDSVLDPTPTESANVWATCLHRSPTQSHRTRLNGAPSLCGPPARCETEATKGEPAPCCALRGSQIGNIFDPRTLHKYVYAVNDPVNRVDPTGRDAPEYRFLLEVEAEVNSPLSGVMRETELTLQKAFECVARLLANEFYAPAGYDVLLEACLEDAGTGL